MADAAPTSVSLTMEQAAALLQRSTSWISQRKAAGYFGDAPKGRGIPLVLLVRGSIAYYEDERQRNQKAGVANEASQARTEKIRMEIARQRGELIPLVDAEALLAEFAGQVRTGIASLPAAATRDPEARRVIKKATDDLLRNLADRAAEAGRNLGSDRVDPPAVSDPDAG